VNRDKLRKILWERFPYVFTGELRPLKIGITNDIAEAMGGIIDKRDVVRMISKRVNNVAYNKIVARGGSRYDLHGQPNGEVSQKEQAFAQDWLEKRQAERIALSERALLLKAIESSGLNHNAYANQKGLDAAKVESDLDKAKAERVERRNERIRLVEEFEACGLAVEIFAKFKKLRPAKLEEIIQKVTLYRTEAAQSEKLSHSYEME
jgi:ProP effector